MSLATPGASASFPGGQKRQQFSPYWGVYASAATLPNASGNVLSAADFRLEAGDTAYVLGAGQYSCTSPGTAGGSNATWVLIPAASSGVGVDNHIVRWDGTTGLQNGVAIESDAGAITAGSGTAVLPAYSFVAFPTNGWYAPSVNSVSLSFGAETLRLSDAGGIRAFGAFPQWDAASTGGHLGLYGSITTGTAANILLAANNAFTAGVGVSQVQTQIAATVNQSSTAAFTLLDLVTTETALGTGAQLLINAKTGVGGATRVFAVTRAGQVLLPDGLVGSPALAFLSEVGLGLYRSGANSLSYVVSNVAYVQFTTNTIRMFTAGASIISGTPGGDIALGGQQTTLATPSVKLFNAGVSFTGSAAAQILTSVQATVNQSSTASFTLLDLATTETTLGSGPQYLINAKTGAGGATPVFSVSRAGGIATTAVSPAAMAATENNYAGIGQSTFARLTPNAANTVLTGILATNVPDGRMLTIVNLGAGTITITNADAGSGAANQLLTSTGAGEILAAGDTVTFIYDLTSTKWRQVTSVA